MAIGETGHAVAEFHLSRSLISQELIQKYGFRNIFVEDDLLTGFKLADSIESCRSNPDMSAVHKAFGHFTASTYRHNEFYPFYQFLCQWNQTHPHDPVHLYGIDVWTQQLNLRKYLEPKLLSLNIESISKHFLVVKDQCFLWSLENLSDYATHIDWPYYEKFKRINPERNARCLENLAQLTEQVQLNSSRIPDVKKILLTLDNGKTQQLIRDTYINFSVAMNHRDAFQARTQLAILDMMSSNSPSILLAHNVHVFQKMSTVADPGWSYVTSSGEWLKSHYGDKMSVIGMGGYKLESRRDGPYPLPVSEKSLDLYLHKQGHQTHFVPSKNFPGEWIVHNETSEGLLINPVEQFDFYFFIDQSAAATAWKP